MIKRIVTLVIIAFVFLCVLGAITSRTKKENKETEKNLAAKTTESSQQSVPIETAKESEPETAIPASEPASEASAIYAEDEVVNTFISEYNRISQSPFEGIEKGNIRTKYLASSLGYWFELLHANDTDKIHVTITETNETAEAGVPGMREVFHSVVKAIDPSLSDDDIYAHFDELSSNEYMVDNDVFGSMIIRYYPDKELSSGHSRGHIEISAQ